MAKMYFRLNRGVYYERDKETGKERCYRAGTAAAECVETEKDLVALLNQQTDPPKFTRIPDHIAQIQKAAMQGAEPTTSNTGPVPVSSPLPPANSHGVDTLESMNVAELKNFANSEEIDIGKAVKKEDIIRIIRNSSMVQS